MSDSAKDLRVLSLFSGCGGLDLGFEGGFNVVSESIHEAILKSQILKSPKKGWITLKPTRFQTVFANDIRPAARKLWNLNFSKKFQTPTDIYQLESIVDLVEKYRRGDRNVFPKNIDVVTGGFPCQDFSLAGKRKGFESDRGKLYIWMKEVIGIVQPKVFIAENVKGLTSLGDALQIIRKDFESIGNGYVVVTPQVLHAAHYGVPQSRERVFFIGFRKDLLKKEAFLALTENNISSDYNPYPSPTHYLPDEDSASEKIKWATTKNAFKDLKEPSQSKDISQKSYSQCKWYGKHCQGNSEIRLNSIGPTIRSEHHGNIEFRRLSLKNGGKYKTEFKKGFLERRLSVRECARIQTFPDDFDFVVPGKEFNISQSEAYKLIGNAVPPLLGYHIAHRLEVLWPKLFKNQL